MKWTYNSVAATYVLIEPDCSARVLPTPRQGWTALVLCGPHNAYRDGFAEATAAQEWAEKTMQRLRDGEQERTV